MLEINQILLCILWNYDCTELVRYSLNNVHLVVRLGSRMKFKKQILYYNLLTVSYSNHKPNVKKYDYLFVKENTVNYGIYI